MSRLLCYHMAILALLVISGCASLIKEPHVTVRSTNITGVDTTGLDIELLFSVENPNPYDISLLSFTYDLQVISVHFSSGVMQKALVFPSGQPVEVRLPFRVLHVDLLGIIKQRPDLDRVPYTLDALLNLYTPFGDLAVPVRKSDTFSVTEPYRPETYLKRILQPFKEIF